MKKLLHERLPEIKNSDCESLAAVAGIKCHAFCNKYACHKEIYRALADEIEKYYGPKPRDPEGNPVHKDMEVDGGVVSHWNVSEDGSWTIFDNDYEEIQCGDKDEPIRLPEPKVLDAEGVPCKKGETVWRLIDSTKWEVTDIHPTEPRISVRQLDTEKEVVGGWFLASEYSHREPDSLEKLRDDMNYSIVEGTYPGTAHEYLRRCAKRLTAIMERDA